MNEDKTKRIAALDAQILELESKRDAVRENMRAAESEARRLRMEFFRADSKVAAKKREIDILRM